MKNINNKTTAIYCRVACKDDDALANQELLLRHYAEENGYENIKVYADNGYSGLNYERPAFKLLQADIESGRVGTIIVKEYSRITRNCFDLPGWALNHRNEESRVKFISVMNDSVMFDAMHKNFQEVFLAIQKKIHSEKIKNALARKKISIH